MFKNIPGTTSLTNTASWDGAALPGVNDVATWGTASDGTSLGGALSYGSTSSPSYEGIDIQLATAAITISTAGTNPLTLGSSGIHLAATGVNLTLSSSLTTGATQSWDIASGLTLLRTGATTTFGAGTTTTLSGAGTVELGGTQALTGAGALVVDGATLFNNLQGGTQSRTGTTTMNSGLIKIQTSISMFGSGTFNVNGGAIGSGNGTGRTITNPVVVGGGFGVGGTGLSTGGVNFSGTVDLGGSVRSINAVATSIFSGIGSGAVFSGIVSNGGITKTGAGIMTLTNAGNTFTGATTVSEGNLAIGKGALSTSSSVTLAGTARLSLGENGAGPHLINNLSGASGATIRTDFTLVTPDTARSLQVNQTVDGTYAGSFLEGGTTRTIALIKTGAATLVLSGTGGYTGGTEITGGKLEVNAMSGIGGGPLAIRNGSTFSYAGAGTETTTRTLDLNAGAGVIEVTQAGATLTWNPGAGTRNQAFSKTGPGTLKLGGAITGGGSVAVNGGTLALQAANDYSGTTTVNNTGTLRIEGSTSSTGLIIVSSGGTLGGAGSMGDVSVTAGGTLSPGGDLTNNLHGYLQSSLASARRDRRVRLDDPAGVFDNDQINLAGRPGRRRGLEHFPAGREALRG
ncbi:MAG: autotransporter-associated beta strand repeat-containing protein [Kiritimatiellia bacterium]